MISCAHRAVPRPDSSSLVAAYGGFAEEDRIMAEEGMADYHTSLLMEDAQ